MSTGDILPGGNPVTDSHLSGGGGGVAIPLDMLHTKETRMSSGRLGLWLVFALTLPFLLVTFKKFFFMDYDFYNKPLIPG